MKYVSCKNCGNIYDKDRKCCPECSEPKILIQVFKCCNCGEVLEEMKEHKCKNNEKENMVY